MPKGIPFEVLKAVPYPREPDKSMKRGQGMVMNNLEQEELRLDTTKPVKFDTDAVVAISVIDRNNPAIWGDYEGELDEIAKKFNIKVDVIGDMSETVSSAVVPVTYERLGIIMEGDGLINTMRHGDPVRSGGGLPFQWMADNYRSWGMPVYVVDGTLIHTDDDMTPEQLVQLYIDKGIIVKTTGKASRGGTLDIYWLADKYRT